MYLIWGNEHGLWWRANRAGYCHNWADAGRYNREEAISICAGSRDGWGGSRAHPAPSEIPVREEDAQACADAFAAMMAAIT